MSILFWDIFRKNDAIDWQILLSIDRLILEIIFSQLSHILFEILVQLCARNVVDYSSNSYSVACEHSCGYHFQ